jgi:hypothetical protein
MSTKKCVVYETLNSLHDLQIVESANKNEVRLSGIFGVCGIKNQNNRIYDKGNYGKMVESLQKVIATEGCPGELEHPNTMNITLENVSHKIESIEMNEDGTITGTILLLNTPKGKIAQALVEGGLPLYISSRGAGSIDESGHVTLSTIKTYDLVGTPGFSQAKLTLKENQKLECLNESLEDGEKSGALWAIINEDEDDDLLGNDDKKDSNDENQDLLDDDSKSSDDEENKDKDNNSDDDEKSEDDDKENNKDIDKEPTMNDLKNAIDTLTDKVTNLEAELHIAKESLEKNSVNYDAIEKWIKEEWAPEHTLEIMESVNESIDEATQNIANGVQKWVCEEFAPEVQTWVVEEFAPEVQNWVCEEFAPEVQNWVCEEFAPEVQNWIVEEYSPEIQNWVCEEFSPEIENWVVEEFAPVVEGWICEEYNPEVQKWVNEEFAPEYKKEIVSEVNQNVSDFMESQKNTKLSEIDALLESIDNKDTDEALETLKESYKTFDEKYKGVYVVENMPAEYRPIWEGLDDQKKEELVRSSKLYDFTKQGVLEKFWEQADMTPTQQVNENHDSDMSDYHKGVFAQMMRLRKV